jgi:Aspartyl protease
MPLIHLAFQNGRPIIHAIVGVSVPRQIALQAAGQPIPHPVTVSLLIDTGAQGTCLDPAAVQSLALTPTGSVLMQTPSTGATPHPCNLYDVSLMIPAPTGAPFFLEATPILESLLRPQGIDGLLGRDILARCVLFYNSPMGGFTLAY